MMNSRRVCVFLEIRMVFLPVSSPTSLLILREYNFLLLVVHQVVYMGPLIFVLWQVCEKRRGCEEHMTSFPFPRELRFPCIPLQFFAH